jgi:hypothetical protein
MIYQNLNEFPESLKFWNYDEVQKNQSELIFPNV